MNITWLTLLNFLYFDEILPLFVCLHVIVIFQKSCFHNNSNKHFSLDELLHINLRDITLAERAKKHEIT